MGDKFSETEGETKKDRDNGTTIPPVVLEGDTPPVVYDAKKDRDGMLDYIGRLREACIVTVNNLKERNNPEEYGQAIARNVHTANVLGMVIQKAHDRTEW